MGKMIGLFIQVKWIGKAGGVLVITLFCLLNASFHAVKNIPTQPIVISQQDTNNALNPVSFPKNYFSTPLDITPLTIVGNFGEPRKAHFHTGMDFRTNQEEGHVVFAVADGYVSRINVSGAGYGNALYITHPNGYVTVYGHLLRFHPKIQERLRKEQFSKQNFSVDFNLTPTEITVKQGDTIALSGNTGGSGGPHLHFEIRDSLERIYNPLLFDYKLKDNLKPILAALKFYPQDSLKYKCDGYRARIAGKQGVYEVVGGVVRINSTHVGISVNAYDVINLSEAHIGIYNITAFDGNHMIYEYQNDRIAFSDRRAVLSHIDYPIFIKEGKKSFHKTFVEPGNNCPLYSNLKNAGLIDLTDGKTHDIHIEVSDFSGNVSIIKFKLQHDKNSKLLVEKKLNYTTRFDYDHSNEFSNSDIKLEMAKGCLFDHVYFNYASSISVETSTYSKIHQLDSSDTQVFDWFNLSIKTENLKPALADKAVIVYKDGNASPVSRGGKFENGFITTKARDFGTYFVRLDTTAPQIKALNVIAGRNMRPYKKLLFKITDNLSGIVDFDTYLDGKWVVTEYDAKSATLFHELDEKLAFGEHIFRVVVVDERKNSAEYSIKFTM